MASVEKLRRRGTELVITVDCGIGSVEEVAAARAAGIQVVVTDHHLPGDRLPDCPIVHPIVSDYPFEGLCAAGVAHKLAIALCDCSGTAERSRRSAAAATPATGTSTWSPWRRSPTWSRWSARTAAWSARDCVFSATAPGSASGR